MKWSDCWSFHWSVRCSHCQAFSTDEQKIPWFKGRIQKPKLNQMINKAKNTQTKTLMLLLLIQLLILQIESLANLTCLNAYRLTWFEDPYIHIYICTYAHMHIYTCKYKYKASLVAQLVKKNLPAVWETWVLSLGWEDPLEEGMATHSSIPA